MAIIFDIQRFNDINNSNGDTLITGSDSGDTIFNQGARVTIAAGKGNDTIFNTGDNVSIDAGGGSDTITNRGNTVTINAGEDADTIYNEIGEGVTIAAGKGNDTIFNTEGANVSIDAGEGSNLIYNYSQSNVTIASGNGSDTIALHATTTLENFGLDDGIVFPGYVNISESNITTVTGGIKVLDITVYGIDQSITEESWDTVEGGFKHSNLTYDLGIKTISYLGQQITELAYNTTPTENNFTISGLKDGVTVEQVETAISVSGTTVTINDESILDKKTVTISEGYKLAVAESLKPSEKIVWTTSGTTATLSNDTEFYTVNTNDEIVYSVESGAAQMAVSGVIKGAVLDTPDENNVMIFDSAILGKKSTVTSNDGNYSINITGTMTGKTFNGTGNADIIDVDSTNGKIKGGAGDDKLYGGTGKNTLYGGAGNDVFVIEGNTFIADYAAGEDTINGTFKTSTLSGSNLELTTDNGTVTIKSAKNKTITFSDGRELIFYADTYYAPLETGLTYNSSRTALTIGEQYEGTEINLADYLSTVTKVTATSATQALKITGTEQNVSITSGAGADTLIGGAGNELIRGGAGADSINGGTGKNTLYGGEGNDVFVYDGGNDFIADYAAGEDSIRLNFDNVTKTTLSGSNAVLTMKDDGGTVTIKSAKNKTITFVDDSGKTTEKIFYGGTSYSPLANGLSYNANRTALTVDKDFAGGTVDLTKNDYLATVTKVTATATSQDLKIVGNTSDNSIKGGAGNDNITGGEGNDKLFGEGGNDTLNGGAGNDTLTGGDGADTFVYEGGKDIITDYAAGDKISLGGAVSEVSYSGKNLVIKIGDGSLTVKNAKGKDVIDTNNKVIDPVANARTYDLLYDSNFLTDSTNLDSITEIKFEVTEIQTATEPAQEDKLLVTYTDK